jgi:riboflavin biosynthesis pyrimidine reductase
MKTRAGRDLTVGGPNLAAQAMKAGLVDEAHLIISPVVVGTARSPCPAIAGHSVSDC